MSNALEQASLIMVPSGYEDGILGSLKPTDGSGDFTFTRGSNISATRVNADDYIEKGYENLLHGSNTLNNLSYWSQDGIDVPTSGQLGYDGSNDAWLVNKISTANASVINSANLPIGLVSTLSFYAKSGTANSIDIYLGPSARIAVNLDTGNTYLLAGNIDYSITDAGNGYKKIVFTYISQVSTFRFQINNNNAGSATGSIYLQNFQINQGLVAYPYVETTTAPVAGGILEDMPRLDYSNGSCPSLLLEPSRTNLFSNSEYFEYLTNADAISLDYNNLTSPEGYVNAVKFTPRAVSAYHRLFYQPVIAVPKDYTISMFVKSNGYDYFLFRISASALGFLNASFNLATGEKDYTSSGIESTIEPYADDWYRVSVTLSANSSPANIYFRPQPSPQTDDSIGLYTGDGTSGCYIYGLQLEQDATYPTSYIPTYGVSQTRLADVYGGDDISSLVGDNQGTLFVEWEENPFLNTDGYVNSIGLFQLIGVDKIYISGRSTSLRLTSDIHINIIYTFSTSGSLKIAFKYNGSEVILFVNGVEAGRETQNDTFNPTSFGNASTSITAGVQENINQILYFPTALSDDECIALTTIS